MYINTLSFGPKVVDKGGSPNFVNASAPSDAAGASAEFSGTTFDVLHAINVNRTNCARQFGRQ
jgi:hypothetical protein